MRLVQSIGARLGVHGAVRTATRAVSQSLERWDSYQLLTARCAGNSPPEFSRASPAR